MERTKSEALHAIEREQQTALAAPGRALRIAWAIRQCDRPWWLVGHLQRPEYFATTTR